MRHTRVRSREQRLRDEQFEQIIQDVVRDELFIRGHKPINEIADNIAAEVMRRLDAGGFAPGLLSTFITPDDDDDDD